MCDNVADHWHLGVGGGLYSCDGAILNCILWGNTATLDGDQLYNSNTPTYSCIQGWTQDGEGNIAEDPQFIDPVNGNLRLLPSSLCIDAGDNSAPEPPETDIIGMRDIVKSCG